MGYDNAPYSKLYGIKYFVGVAEVFDVLGVRWKLQLPVIDVIE